LQCVAVCCSVLQCVAVCCTQCLPDTLECDAMHCSCVVVCCSAISAEVVGHTVCQANFGVLQCAVHDAVCCSEIVFPFHFFHTKIRVGETLCSFLSYDKICN